jgi:hypothetical protein
MFDGGGSGVGNGFPPGYAAHGSANDAGFVTSTVLPNGAFSG